jgi:hypothetical protein
MIVSAIYAALSSTFKHFQALSSILPHMADEPVPRQSGFAR